MTVQKEYDIDFKYKDAYSNWEWRKQHCTLYADTKEHAVAKCVRMYGLGEDCPYEILSVKENK